MMYYSKVKVEPFPKKVSKTIEKSLGYDGSLSIKFLKELGLTDEDEFCVYENENNREVFISYTLSRLETDKEVAKRVAKEEAYNKRYDEYHANKKNK
jgi:hypothetical protein